MTNVATYRLICPSRPDLNRKTIQVPDTDPVTAPFEIAYEIEPDANGRRRFIPAVLVR